MVNNFHLIGNLTKDVEEVQGQDFISGSIAQSSKKKDGTDHTTFLPFVYFGKAKEAFLKHGKKGNEVYLEGLVTSYKNKENHTVLSLNVRKFQITNFRNGGGDAQNGNTAQNNYDQNYGY